jgi:oxygen-dependent protoporphyrinogen oxidase
MSPEVVSAIGEDAARAAAELDRAPLADLPADVTLGALVRARMGDRVVARILTPVVAGVHAADADLVEAEAVVPGLLSALRQEGGLAAAAARLRAASGVPGAAVNGLRGGMTTLVRALEVQARGLGVTIRTDTPALAIERTSGDWRVVTPGGPLAADALVVAVDAPSAAGLLTSVPDVADPLSRIAVGDVVVCAAVLRAPELDEDPVGSGLLVQPGHPRVRAKALTHATAKWEWIRAAYGPGRHLVRLSYGRDGRVAEALTELPDIVRADLQTVFGLGEPVIEDFCIRRWNRSLVFPRPGHRAAVANLRAAVADLPTLDVVGAGLGGNGLAGTIGLSQGSR